MKFFRRQKAKRLVGGPPNENKSDISAENYNPSNGMSFSKH